jgi:2-hydroxy-3-keto-5-methylthiopentenyl-1-phosphate phosphatase
VTAVQLVVDWDGTVTERDSLHMVLEHFGDLAVYRAAEEALGRGLPLNDVIAMEMRTVRAPLEEVLDWLLAEVRVRPGFADLVGRTDPIVVSAGFHELIEPVLARERVAPRVVANRLDPRPEGWEASFRDVLPCEVCGEPCKRAAVRDLGAFTYVGDGVSDRCVALAADRVFARDALAAWLELQGTPYEPFVDFVDLAARL